MSFNSPSHSKSADYPTESNAFVGCNLNDAVVSWRFSLILAMMLNAFPLRGETLEKQLTFAPHGHILTNSATWSPDSRWLVYDVRSDPAGDQFDGTRIERINVSTGDVQVLFQSQNGANCGVATTSPRDGTVVFIHGPETPNQDWPYSAYHRRGVLVNPYKPGHATNLDARNVVAPFTAGALRGGTHVHTFSGDGEWVSFTYEDHVLATRSAAEDADTEADASKHYDLNQRNVGVSVPVRSVRTPKAHPRNHDGSHFSVVVTRTHNAPKPGSDEIERAFSDAWIGRDGYMKADGSRQHRALAFQGHVRTISGETISEVFVVDIPGDVTVPANDGPLQGTSTLRPRPPRGTQQRRLTYTVERKYPGIQGIRHWLRSSPNGSQIAFLMKSDDGVAQLWTISPNGGSPRQLTNNPHSIGSAFSWSPDGTMIAHVMDQSVCVTLVDSGETLRLTDRSAGEVRPEACVFSPDGSMIAYVRQVSTDERATQKRNQIFVLDVKAAMEEQP